MNIVQIVLIAVFLEPSGYQIAVVVETVPIHLVLPLQIIPATLSIGAVSYTHLDVYKRQLIEGDWYLLDENGYRLCGWQNVDGARYYLCLLYTSRCV